MSFSIGHRAKAICDRCGDKIPYLALKTESKTNYRVCKSCLDTPHPQDYPTRLSAVNDPEALRNPRPDNDVTAGEGAVYIKDYTHGQTPVGYNFESIPIDIEIGEVTVVIS